MKNLYCIYLWSNWSVFMSPCNLNNLIVKNTLPGNYHKAKSMQTIKIAINNKHLIQYIFSLITFVNNKKVTISCIQVIKYTLYQKLTTSDLFTHFRLNQYWWQLPTEPNFLSESWSESNHIPERNSLSSLTDKNKLGNLKREL
jgi:hypothetical protein